MFLKDDDVVRRKELQASFRKNYEVEPRELQIEAILSLTHQRDTVLLESTGYGKSRIAELFVLIHAKARWPIVLILNPLDALGDNQVGTIFFII